jgi:hypothetical protein
MAHDRLVRVSIYEEGESSGKFLGYVWGLLDDCADEEDFIVLYTRSSRAIEDLGGSIGEPLGLSLMEIDTAIDVAECWTPGCVYAEAAKLALLGEAA